MFFWISDKTFRLIVSIIHLIVSLFCSMWTLCSYFNRFNKILNVCVDNLINKYYSRSGTLRHKSDLCNWMTFLNVLHSSVQASFAYMERDIDLFCARVLLLCDRWLHSACVRYMCDFMQSADLCGSERQTFPRICLQCVNFIHSRSHICKIR